MADRRGGFAVYIGEGHYVIVQAQSLARKILQRAPDTKVETTASSEQPSTACSKK